MSCWSSPSGPITATDFLGSSGSALSSFLSKTIGLARGGARLVAVGRLQRLRSAILVWSTYGWSNRPARNFTRRIRRTASSRRRIEIWPVDSSCLPLSRMLVDTISESVPAFSASAPADGPSAATPWPHGPSSGFLGGHARSSATAV